MVERRGVYRVLVGKREVKRTLDRTRRRWEVNIMVDIQVVRCGGMDWIELAQDPKNFG
jgi:ribosomal protein L28